MENGLSEPPYFRKRGRRSGVPGLRQVLQSGVNVGVLFATLANVLLAAAPPRSLFLVGILPALLVFWIRRAVPEPEEWCAAKKCARPEQLGISNLFRGEIRRVTWWVMIVCGVSLTAHWAFMFWHQQHLRNLPDVLNLSAEAKNKLASVALYLVMVSSILGNFFAGLMAKLFGYRATIRGSCLPPILLPCWAHIQYPALMKALMWWFPAIGFCQGVFGLFTMYLPALIPYLVAHHRSGILL